MPEIHARLFVIAAPSGAGKTTLVRALITHNPELRFSISYTTREKRSNEAEGVDYLFVDTKKFAALRVEGELLESATVFDHLYATSRSQVDQHLEDGHSVVLEIDWQGARQVRESMPDCVTIFILPPSLPELERRLRDRRTDSDDVIARRLAEAASEMDRWEEFDYVVINDDLGRAIIDLEAVLAGKGAPHATKDAALRARVVDVIGL
jgi:guanylate kinase